MSDAELKVDEYQLANCIASGSSSQVWEVRDAGGQAYAMKLLLAEAFKDASQVAVLKHEAKVGQALEHPNFLRVHKFAKTKAHAYFVMDLFRSPNVKSLVASEPLAVQGRFGKLVEQLCQALAYMHGKGWLHHDLKPENILFSRSAEMRLIDFSLSMRRQGGLAKVFAGKVKTIQGTRTYIAPETIKKQYPTPQSDIYSLGVTLFEVLTGGPPFRGSSPNDLLMRHLSTTPPSPSDLNPNVTAEADRFILRLLAKKPEQRPKDMEEVAAEFRSLRVFKRDPLELAVEAEKKEEGLGSKSRLDSRADAARVASGEPAPEKPKPKPAPKPAVAAAPPAPAPSSAPGYGQPAYPQGAYAAAGYGPPPGYPGYGDPNAGFAPPPGYGPPPGYAPPGYGPPPGYAAPPGYGPPPGYGAPQGPPPGWGPPVASPPGPPQGQPPASVPPQTAPAGSPAQVPPRTFLPGQGRPTDQHPTQQDATDDLPLMDELPDVL